MPWVFLLAYTCSGLASLVYQVCWTRLLTLYIGHTTAAASAVVAAFLGGLAIGAGVGGRLASRLSPRRALVSYALLEIAVAAIAVLIPFELGAFTPLLAWAYHDGTATAAFAVIRLLVCLVAVFLPAAALGATFPLAVRWFAADDGNRARSAGLLYTLNSAGAALGAIVAGFVLIPALGVSGATGVAIAASLTAAAAVALVVITTRHDPASQTPRAERPSSGKKRSATVPRKRQSPVTRALEPRWLAATILAVSGFAALMHEIAWTRVLTMVFGPTIYAFAAALAAVIVGIALGSSAGTAIVSRTRQPAVWVGLLLGAAAVVGIWTSSLAGGPIPRAVAEQIAAAPGLMDQQLIRGALVTTALILPVSALLGAVFPLALGMIDNPARSAAGEFGFVYATNTIGAVAGSLLTGFVLIPAVGLEGALKAVTVALIVASALVLGLASVRGRSRAAGGVICVVALIVMATSAPWDRELLASGAYLYAPFAPKDANLEALLKAGTLLYYREGASATVSVKRLTGTTTLAVDGKTDASNRSDMLTQKLVAHLPLLLHDAPREVAIVGLGSGVTVGAALTHPIARADVIEISHEVVEASGLFVRENRNALADPRTRLIIGDGRSHLQLSRKKYDVIISEPSNPWIAGVAALFTREFFVAARARLAPGGLICQWANAYNISDRDLRAIVQTFLSVFPHGTAWLVGADDVVLLASDGPLDERLSKVERNWHRPGVAEDLATVAAVEPFSVWSLFVGGPAELGEYAAGADVLTDDRMTLEFSGPRELRGRGIGENGATLRALMAPGSGPAVIASARAAPSSGAWQRRGVMMAARDAHGNAYDDFVKALTLDPANTAALDGLVRAAILTRRSSSALEWIGTLGPLRQQAPAMQIARSKLLASTGARVEAIDAAMRASASGGESTAALEQLAALYADDGNVAQLDGAVVKLRAAAPQSPATFYYAAVSAFLRGQAEEALGLVERALAVDVSYAAAYDLMGAAQTRLGRPAAARKAFEESLQFDAHDSSAYANLGLLALSEGDTHAAADYFAEALWLDEDSSLARQGLLKSNGSKVQ